MGKCFHKLKSNKTTFTSAYLGTKVTFIICEIVFRVNFAYFRNTVNTINSIALFSFIWMTVVLVVIQLLV